MGPRSSPPNVNLAARGATVSSRILLVDDHRMFGELLAYRLDEQPDFEIVGIAADADEGLQEARTQQPDIVIVDHRLPGDDGVKLAGDIRAELPDVGLVMLTGDDNDALLRAALSAGCAGFVRKDAPIEELVRVVRAVREGAPALGHDAVVRLASPASPAARRRGLTTRELEVLDLLAEGASTQRIAEQLFISVNTARNHVQRVIRKLDAHSRLEAVATARRSGILDSARA